MDWIADTLADFGRQIGIDQLQADPEGRLRLQTDGGSELAVEQVLRDGQDELLVYWTLPVGYQAGAWVQAAFARAHEEAPARWPVQVGLRSGGPDTQGVLLVRTPARGFTPQALGQVMDLLRRWREALRAVA
jgi:type III secretion system chaperone SycN